MPSVVVDPLLRASEPDHNERAFPMRLRKADLRGRVKGNLEFRFENRGLTSYAGLEFVRRYLAVVRFAEAKQPAAVPNVNLDPPLKVGRPHRCEGE